MKANAFLGTLRTSIVENFMVKNLLVLGDYGDITGGTSTVINSVTPRLKKSFDEILVIAPRRRRRLYQDFVDDNIKVTYQPCGTIPYVTVSQPLIKTARICTKILKESGNFKPSVTWVNDEALQVSAKICGLSNRIRTVHGLPRVSMDLEKEVINVFEWKLSMWVLNILEREGLKDVSAITTYSNYLKNKIQAYFSPTAQIHVIHNGIDPALFHPTLMEKEDVITYVGRFAIIKGIHNLLQAMKYVHRFYPNWKLWLVGDTFDQSMEYFKNIYNNRVVWRGHVHHNDIPNILNHSKIFIMPTIRDGFEIALMEAVASGVPSITTSAYERKEIYKGLVTFCHKDDHIDLAKKIIEVIDNWEEYRKKAVEASRIARAKFSWDQIAKEYLKVFEGAM